MTKIEITHHTFVLPNLQLTSGTNEQQSGVKIAQITDMHRSNLTSDKILHKSIQLVNEQKPDLIVLTGDYISSRKEDIEPVTSMISNLRAPLGTIAILGNHDHHTDGAAVRRALERVGVTVLQNDSMLIDKHLRLVGLDDDRYHHTDIKRSLAKVVEGEALLVLAHNPALVEKLSDLECLVLSGHTHGGQVHLPILTARELRRIGAKHYKAGWYKVGKASVYVCRGLGNVGVPFRLFCRPEIAFFNLVNDA